MGVVYTAIVIAALIGAILYSVILYVVYEPYTVKNGIGIPEHRLVPALFAAALLPAGLFLFGWTSRTSIVWVVPTIGVVFFGVAAFVVRYFVLVLYSLPKWGFPNLLYRIQLLQCIVVYLPTSYPRYAASLFAMNSKSPSTFQSISDAAKKINNTRLSRSTQCLCCHRRPFCSSPLLQPWCRQGMLATRRFELRLLHRYVYFVFLRRSDACLE